MFQWDELQLFLKKVAGRHGRPGYEPSEEDVMWVIVKATKCVHAHACDNILHTVTALPKALQRCDLRR
jgi:hypothetical protein